MSKQESCLGAPEHLLTLMQAKAKCFDTLSTSLHTEKVSIYSGLNRVLSKNIIAPINVPSNMNSAMDGFALAKSDLANGQPFSIIGSAYAGAPFTQSVSHNQCVKIMTGALIPENTDTVIPQEFVKQKNKQIHVDEYCAGDNIRLAGEDLKKGSVVIDKGCLLEPSHLGLLASLGIEEVNVWCKLRVAFLSTGNELCSLGSKLLAGQIYDSNLYTLFGLLSNLGVELSNLGVVRDNPEDIQSALIKASELADIVITTGGVSVGEADHVKKVLEDIGVIDFWKLAIKPGRPLTFGKINKAYFFGLPGNPVATMITFYQVVQPFIKRMMGQTHNIEPLLVDAISVTAIEKSEGRREFVRAILSQDNNKLTVKKLDKQGSGILSSMSQANCLIVLSEKMKPVKAKDIVQVQPFYGLI